MISQLLEQGIEVWDGDFYHMWSAIFRAWFNSSLGWTVLQERYVETIPSFRVEVAIDANGVSIQDGEFDRAVQSKLALVVVVRSELKWTEQGQKNILEELETAMRETLLESGIPVVWRIAAIGFHWIAFSQEGPARAERLTEWRNDILSPGSWQAMRDLFDTIKRSIRMSEDSTEYKDWFIYSEHERMSQLLEQGIVVEEPEFYFMWNHIFREWFSLSQGWMVLQERYVENIPSFTVKVVIDARGVSVQDGELKRAVDSKPALVAVVRHTLK
ncbi:hypothetical protein FS837_008177 [Tulasnella sp. UAMH 9824]|nr:hypothetical protein FS837_008177 [Tulasnella sp. UAMH 9824]